MLHSTDKPDPERRPGSSKKLLTLEGENMLSECILHDHFRTTLPLLPF